MTHRLATNYAKNYCNRTLSVKVIVENVVTCFFGTQCRHHVNKFIRFLKTTTVNILLHATVSAMDYTPNFVSVQGVFSLYLSVHGLPKGPGKFLMGSW